MVELAAIDERQEDKERSMLKDVLKQLRELCRVLGDYIRSWEQELERPRYVMDKMWQNVRSNDAKTMNLDKDIEEILNKAKQTVWNGSTKTTRVWTEKEEDDP